MYVNIIASVQLKNNGKNTEVVDFYKNSSENLLNWLVSEGI